MRLSREGSTFFSQLWLKGNLSLKALPSALRSLDLQT
jgi:hypothetical protein